MARLANKIMEAFVGLRVDDSDLGGDVARAKGKIGEQFAQAGTTAGQKFKAAFGAASQGATNAAQQNATGMAGGAGGGGGANNVPMGGGGMGPMFGSIIGGIGASTLGMLTNSVVIGLVAKRLEQQISNALDYGNEKYRNVAGGLGSIDSAQGMDRVAAAAAEKKRVQLELDAERSNPMRGKATDFVRGVLGRLGFDVPQTEKELEFQAKVFADAEATAIAVARKQTDRQLTRQNELQSDSVLAGIAFDIRQASQRFVSPGGRR
jgi:hypothetical protein